MDSERRWLLAIDTSTEQASIAVTDGTALAGLSWPAGRDQTTSVLAEIDHLLELTGADRAHLRAIAVATGPGMFNGVRVGMSVAKGLHLGLGLPLIGVSTLEATAYPVAGLGAAVIAVIAAGRGRVIWAATSEAVEPVNASFEELLAALTARSGGTIVAGDLTPEQAARLRALPGLHVAARPATASRACAIAEIGWMRTAAGAFDDPSALAPVYVHSRAAARAG